MPNVSRLLLLGVFVFISGCATTSRNKETASPDLARADIRPQDSLTCNGPAKLKVRFFDVEQALAALVELPGGERF